MANETRIERFFRQLDPEYQHRYEIYDETVLKCLAPQGVWVDIGCGRNEHVAAFGSKAAYALGIDVTEHPQRIPAPFIRADLRHLPLHAHSVDLVTLRMVVEHLERIPDDFFAINRILKPGGQLIILTTNSVSPVIFLPRLLPYRWKEWLLRKSFQVESGDLFPTYHRFNSPQKLRRGVYDLQLVSLKFLEQVPFSRFWLTLIFGSWYLLTKPFFCRRIRSNMLAVFQRISTKS